jgi:hypothetical protein
VVLVIEFYPGRYNVHYTTIGKNLKQRINIRPRKCIKVPKYFSLSGADIPGHLLYYTSDPSTTSANIKYKQYQKFEPKILVWLAVSSEGCSKPYIHKGNQEESFTQKIHILA